jgi:hypothetical protein
MPLEDGPLEDGPLEQGRMQRFVAALLEQSGALVDHLDRDGLEVMLPPPLQQALGLGEISRLGFGATLPEGAKRVGIENEWLGRFDRVMGERGRWSRRVLAQAGRKAPDAERLLDQELGLENATFRLLDVAPAWTRYLVLEFRFTALSDEKREGTQRLAINLATGAMPDRLAPWLDEADDDADVPVEAALPAVWERDRIVERVQRALPWRVEATLQPFVKALHRRLARDQDRLHTYYNDLHREALQRAAPPASDATGAQRAASRAASIARDYRSKLDDLTRKYALRTTVAWVQTLEVVVPVHRLTVQIRRRKAERVMAMDVNSITRRLEAPPCEATWSVERPRLVCDAALHLVTPAGLAPCAACGRPYCRACHPRHCPKCVHAGILSAFAGAAAASSTSGGA